MQTNLQACLNLPGWSCHLHLSGKKTHDMKVSSLFSHSGVGNEVWRLVTNMHFCTVETCCLFPPPPLKTLFFSGEIKKDMHFPVHPLKYCNRLLFSLSPKVFGWNNRKSSKFTHNHKQTSFSLPLSPPPSSPPFPSSFSLFLKEARFRDLLPPPLPQDEL